MEAAEQLSSEGIDVEVIDLRSLVPLDWETVLTSADKTGRVLVLHDAALTAGPGAEIVARIAEASGTGAIGPVRCRRLAGMDAVAPQIIALEEAMLPDKDLIVGTLREMVAQS